MRPGARARPGRAGQPVPVVWRSAISLRWRISMTTVLQFSLPGVAPEQLSVEQAGCLLSVRAERSPAPGVRYLRRQIPVGRFEAHYRLPPYVEVERASLERGIL